MNPDRPITLLVAALGGQGGGVLADWIAHAARAQGRLVQATSTPGVSQRTGATTYYLEVAPSPARGAAPPVLGLVPVAGQVDVLVCAELLEAARMMERGFASPQRTTLIASTHRVYATREKTTGGDGRFDATRIEAAARALSRRALLLDLDALRRRHRAAISAALFGAIGGSGALGLTRAACEEAIRAGGVGVEASLAAFAEAWQAACNDAPGPAADARSPGPAPELGGLLARRVEALPAPVAEMARIGAAQVRDYQDETYAQRYVERVARVAAAERGGTHGIAREAARSLALWMCYEDIAQVARLKARASRLARIRAQAGAGADEIVHVREFFKPRAEEIAAMLPSALGAWLERHAAGRPASGRGLTLPSSSVTGALALRAAVALRRWRPRSLRFAREQAAIEDWLQRLQAALQGEADEAGALRLARLPRLLKGYGDTHAAGRERFERALAGPSADVAPRPAVIPIVPR